MVNTNLPFMRGDAEVPADIYDIIIYDPDLNYPLFQTPRQPVSVPDYIIDLHVSTLIKDGGTLQIGIGALGDAIAYGLNLRNNHNDAYKKLIAQSGIGDTYGQLIQAVGGTDPFDQGLYGSTEMLVDGFVQLYKGGVIKRKVYHHAGVQRLINDGKLKEKIPQDYEIPEQFRNNTPERLAATLKEFKAMGLFPDFPFGSIFSDVELLIAYALKLMKAKAAGPEAAEFPKIMKALPTDIPENIKPFMERMGFAAPAAPEEVQTQKMMLLAFRLAGFC
jgi:hypothetical protein